MAIGTPPIETPGETQVPPQFPPTGSVPETESTARGRKRLLLGSPFASLHPGLNSGPSLVREKFQKLQGSVVLGITKQKEEHLPAPST